MAPCEFCGEERLLDLAEVWLEERAWIFDTCCEEYHETLLEDLEHAATLSPQERLRFLAPLRELFAGFGITLRQAFLSDAEQAHRLDYGVTLGPIKRDDAREFVRQHHRHNPPPAGWRWGSGIYNGDQLVGVAMVGRPVSPALPQDRWVEVNRLCIDADLEPALVWNACSMAYAAAAREAKKRGFERIITYTQAAETGGTLRAAGWQNDAETEGHRSKGGSWSRVGRPRKDHGNTGPKTRWSKKLRAPSAQPAPIAAAA